MSEYYNQILYVGCVSRERAHGNLHHFIHAHYRKYTKNIESSAEIIRFASQVILGHSVYVAVNSVLTLLIKYTPTCTMRQMYTVFWQTFYKTVP